MTTASSVPPEPTTGVVTGIGLRPIGTPLPLGFLGLCVATFCLAGLQLGWVPQEQGKSIALVVLGSTVPVQFIACVFGFLARDPVAGTGMGVLAGTWAAVALVTVQSPPGADSAGLGLLLLAAAAAMLVPAVAGRTKTVAAAVMGMSAVRFAVTGLAHLTGSSGWQSTAGWIGVLLTVVSLYAALAFELEGVTKPCGAAAVAAQRRRHSDERGRGRPAHRPHAEARGAPATVSREKPTVWKPSCQAPATL